MQFEQFQLHADVEEKHWWFLARRQIMRDAVRRAVPPGRDKIVVDVGCGTGANIAALARDYSAIGIDTSEEGIAFARQRFPDVQFVHGFAPQDLGDTAGKADVFLIMDVLEHVPDDFQFLSDLLSVAKPGAHFLITVPADKSLWSPHDVAFGHYRRYDRKRLEAVWDGLPVTARLVSHYNSRLYPIVKTLRRISQARGRSWGATSTDFNTPPAPVNRALQNIFAGESGVLMSTVEKTRGGFGAGVSLIALLRRDEGAITPRPRPSHIAPDEHDPETERAG